MSVIDKLASSLNRRDEIPNQELAKEIVLTKDQKAIKELIQNLSGKRAIQNDCIKVLYEIGEKEPKLIADYINKFVSLLGNKNNRLQWGAMTALGTITHERPKEIYAELPNILATVDKGSVITRDHAVNILIALCSSEEYRESSFVLLIEQLLKSPTNQLPMYAEKSMSIVNDNNKTLFIEALTSRLGDIEKETKRKRVEKVIRKVANKK